MLPHTVQDKFEQMEVLFEEFFDDNSLSLAKVRQFGEDNMFFISKAARTKETRKGSMTPHLYTVRSLSDPLRTS